MTAKSNLAAALATGLLLAAPAATPAFADGDGIINEVRLGMYDHDTSVAGNDEEDGVDINVEILFDSPSWMEWAFSPRPNLGASINTAGDTSLVHAGFAWDFYLLDPLWVEASLGVAAHDGETSEVPGRKALGCKLNFHESASIGFDLTANHRIMATIEHISNASLCNENEGLTNLGMRYGYKF